MGVLHVEKAPLVAKTLSTSFPQIFLKCSSSFPFKAPTPRKACPKSSTSLFLRDLYVAWSVLGRYVQRLKWNMLWPALGSLLLHRCVHDLIVRKSQPFSPSWNCPRATHTLSLTQGHTTTNQLCWFCDTVWNFNRLHARPYWGSQWISTASADKATNKPSREPKFVMVTMELHYRQAAAGCWESWDTHSRWWYRETIAVWPECSGRDKLRGGKKTRIHQRVVNNDNYSKPSIVKNCSKRNTKWWAWTCHDWLVLLHLP